MKRVIAWFAENHVAANLLMGALIVGGLATLPTIPRKSFPDVDIDVVQVSVEYQGAAPEEVEEGVCVRVEEEIDGIEGVERILSTSVEGVCVVSAELIFGADADKALNDVKTRVDALDTLPEETEKPVITRVTIERGVIDVAVSGNADEATLKEFGDFVRDEITRLPGITQVEVTSTRPYEVSIEVSEQALRRHRLTFDQVVGAVRRSSLDLPGGSIKSPGGEILLRTKGQAYRGPEFEKLVLLTRADGTRVTLGEVAQVVDGFEDTDQSASFDGEPAVMVRVFRVGDQNVLEIADSVKSHLPILQRQMPEGIRLTVWRDASQMLRGRLDTLLENARAGFLLVLAVLALFLRPRLAFWVGVGVPIAVCGALWVFPVLGLDIDSLSTFGFILVLGILVDDAIVVGENVYTHQRRGEDRLAGAIRGTQEVAVPVIFGVLTTMLAFLPMILIGGRMGQIIGVAAAVVLVCLLFSLVESQLVLPAHLAHGRAERDDGRSNRLARAFGRLQERFASGLERFTSGSFRELLERALEWRYLTVAVGVALLLWAVAIVASGRLYFAFFPPLEADYVSAQLTLPQGTPVEATAEAVAHLEAAADRLEREIDAQFAAPGESLFRHRLSALGEQPFRDQEAQSPQGAGRVASVGAHLGEVTLELVPAEERSIGASTVAQRWRELTGPVPDAVELVFASNRFSVGEEINIQLAGPDIAELREAADRLKARLAEYPGVIDIADSFRAGKREVELSILPTAEALGLSLSDLARQVRQAFYGAEAQRIQRGRDDVRVMVRYPRAERRSLGDLENMRIRTPDGAEVPFRTVARAELGRGYSSIRRADRQRVINVTADVNRTQVSSNDVVRDLEAGALPEILSDYPGMSYALEGIQREQKRAFGLMFRWYVVALFGIYALLGVPLRSYSQPLLIMSVIPFGIVGAIAGHLITGRYLSFMSVVGMVALSGVVVNGSLVLVHFVNQRRAAGAPLGDAVRMAARARLRPIVLTAITTFAGLTPLMFERSVEAQFLIPTAISLAYGVVFSAAITLLVVPAGYLILEDLRSLPARLRRSTSPAARTEGEGRAAPA